MIRLKKLGMIREVETQSEADRYVAIGYEITDQVDSEADEAGAELEAHTAAELKEMCAAQSITFPGNASKKVLIDLLVAAHKVQP